MGLLMLITGIFGVGYAAMYGHPVQHAFLFDVIEGLLITFGAAFSCGE